MLLISLLHILAY